MGHLPKLYLRFGKGAGGGLEGWLPTHVGVIVQILKLVPKDQQQGIGNL